MTTVINAMWEPEDIVLPRGGDKTLVINIMEPEPSSAYANMTGHVVVFRAVGRGFVIERTISSFGDFSGMPCQAAIHLTKAETRNLSDEPTPWELEDRFGGKEAPFLGGNLFGAGGSNSDA